MPQGRLWVRQRPPEFLPGGRRKTVVRQVPGLTGSYSMTSTCHRCSQPWQTKDHDCFDVGGQG